MSNIYINHHLQCQECYFIKLHVLQIVNDFAEIKSHDFLIGF